MRNSTLILAAALLTLPACGTDTAANKPVENKAVESKAVDKAVDKPIDPPVAAKPTEVPAATKPVEVPTATDPAPATPPDADPDAAFDPEPADPDAAVAGPPATGPKQTANAWRPCELKIKPCMKDGQPCTDDGGGCSVMLARFLPEGVPLEVHIEKPEVLRWRYAADGRLLASPGWVYEHTDATSGFRRGKGERKKVAVTFDDQGRLSQIGDRRFEYLPDGHAAGYSTRRKDGTWERNVTYDWRPNETYGLQSTYSDEDEFCQPVPSSARLDPQGRVVREVFDDCRIYYSAYTVRYHYDALGRPDTLKIECKDGEVPVPWTLALKYECL